MRSPARPPVIDPATLGVRASPDGARREERSRVDLDPRRFFSADVTEPELRAIEAWAAGTGRVERSEGLRVGSGGTLHAARRGPHCEILFGPLRADRCACGRQVGPKHRGVSCPRCGVTPGDPGVRATQWGHVACRVGVTHPALPGDGFSAFVHSIPVSPPAGRVAPPLPHGLVPTPTAEDLAIARLVAACGRLDQLDAYGAPEGVIAHAQAAADDALRELCAPSTGERSIFFGPTGPGPVLVARPPPRGPVGRDTPLVDGLAFWGDALVSTGRAGLRLTPLRTGRGRRLAAGPCRVLGVVGSVAVFDGQHVSDPRFAAADGYAALDLVTGLCQAALPGAPRIAFGKDQPEDAWAVEIATGRIAPLSIPSDRPAFGAYSPDLAALLVIGDECGPLLDDATGLPLFDLAAFPDEPVPLEGGGRGSRGGEGGPPAVAHLGGRRWRVLLPSGVVGELDEAGATVRWAIRGPYSAAAFSPDGARLAVARGGSIRILDADGRLLRTVSVSTPGRRRARESPT